MDAKDPSKDTGPRIPELEEKITEFWEKNGIFEKSLEKTKDGKPYTFYDGPPFATGLPHYGHILASTIKDVIPRYQTMRGRFVRRRWGWDCHGLPIEALVEKELGISGKKQIEEIGIKKFNETCRSMVLRFADEWGKMVRRMGRWVDFENSYKTMDRDYMESVWWAFKQVYDKGLAYEGRKVLLYCPRCETPISNFEVAMDNSYKDVTEESVYIKFKVKNSKLKVGGGREVEFADPTYLLAWTTTPWTLPGNVALAVGADIEYVKAKVGGETLIVAKALAEKVLPEGYAIDSEVKGSDLVGLSYEPLFEVPEVAASEKSFKIYAADFVTTEDGTGIVHTAVVYGEDDYQLGLREDMPIVPLLDEKGHFNEQAPELVRGQYFKKSEKAIKEDLEQRGLLLKREDYAHSYPHCWRCSTALYYNAIPAWFINVQKIKPDLLRTNKKQINWFPEHLKHGRYEKSVESAPDWNISRNRYWGNPIPVWRCEDCGKNTVIGGLDDLRKHSVDNQLPLNDSGEVDLHRPYIDEVILKCDCGGNMRRTPEIFDSWVEAGSMPFSEYHYPFENKEVFENRFPAQFVAEYIAQTRAWFYVMHVISQIIFGKAPFENVVTTGNILAEDGSKMSKSKNNYPDPWLVIDKHGVDSLRFYLMSSAVMQADDINFSEKDLETVHRRVTMLLWNVHQYFMTYAGQSGSATGEGIFTVPRSGNVLDRWVLARSKELVSGVTGGLDGYDTPRAARAIAEFVDDLSIWYLRRSRGREGAEFFPVFRYVLATTSQVIAPFMPHIAEAIYRDLRGERDPESVHLTGWPEMEELNSDEVALVEGMAIVREAASVGLAARKEMNIPVRQPLARLWIEMESGEPLHEDLMEVLLAELNVKASDPELLDTRDENIKNYPINARRMRSLYIDTGMTPELKLEGEVRKLERAIQERRKEMGLKVGDMARLKYSPASGATGTVFGAVDMKKTYLSEVEKDTGGVPGTFELERVDK
jgi:isoleucyl-tRNA synthetase